MVVLFTLVMPVLLITMSSRFSSDKIQLVDISTRDEVDESDMISTANYEKDVPSIVEEPEPTWQSKGRKLARAFSPWGAKDRYGWCVDNAKGANGLLFLKIEKCASSTGAGIGLNIAHNVARRKHHRCVSHVYHHRTQRLPIPTRNKNKSLLWTIVRHPAKRALSSYFFFEVSHDGKTPTDKAMRRYLREEKNFQIASMTESSLRNYTVEDVIKEMDFIAVSERMDESLVVFRLLNGLRRKDVIVLSAKKHGGYDGGMHGGCHKIVPSYTTPAIEDYLSSSFIKNNDDYILYSAANASLDMTIDMLGRELVEKEVRYHQYLQTVANKYCQEEAKFPCSDEGKHQLELSSKSCYKRDWGCGYKCVFKKLTRLD